MTDSSQIREHMEVIGADGVHVGTVDRVEGDLIKLTRKDSSAQIEGAEGKHEGHHHTIPLGLVLSFTPGVTYRSYTPDFGGSGGNSVKYVDVSIGLRARI